MIENMITLISCDKLIELSMNNLSSGVILYITLMKKYYMKLVTNSLTTNDAVKQMFMFNT